MKTSDFVHRYEDSWGNACYVVAEERDGRYSAPQTRAASKRTGMPMIYGPLSQIVPYAYHYGRRADALRRARQLYGIEETQ